MTEATESEVAGTTVTIFDNGTQIGTATVGSDGTWSDQVTLRRGANSITASDTDLAGNTGTSTAVTLHAGDGRRRRSRSPLRAVRPTGDARRSTGTVTEATESEVAGTTVTIFDNGTTDRHRDGGLGRGVERPR